MALQMKEQQGIVHRLEANDKLSIELVKHLELQLSSIKADNDRLSAELQSAREQVASMQESAAQLSSIKAANDAVIADIKANFEKLNIELSHAVAQSNVCFIVITISN
jgi:FtsZ-binding cell division protein ZapB